ncbi:oxysterol-binding protein-related protein 10 isoform X3 [Salmo trutta]|uniref:oxysterol-binding protein-related protein 10 isoform X3 n=1 Tax=Salmo trutta TaxID=8032 RepID=UPI001131D6A2|nr:oxysterol-binding protein-related protein 10-like isoform X3 [Salmo trutta]
MDKHPGSNTINPASCHGNPAARRLDGGGGGPCPHSLGSEAGTAGSRGGVSGDSGSTPHQTRKRRLEGVLNKYTNLLQGWQNRYFVLDPDIGQLQYFVNEHSKNQKPRGSLPLIGASVALSDELLHMFTVLSVTGEAYKLRASDAGEQQLWMSQMQLCARRHSDSSAKVMTQAEGQQKNLVNSIESLPSRGPLSSLDQDLLLLKATSAATLSCLGECLHMLQHNVSQAAQHVTLGRSDSQDRSQSPIHKQTSSQSNSNISSQTHNHNHNQFKKQMSLDPNHFPTAPSDSFAGWPRSPSEKQVTNRGGTPLPHVPSPAHINKEVVINSVQAPPTPESIDPSEEMTDTEDSEEEDLGVREDQRNIILHLLSQLKLGMDLTRVVLPTFILEKRSLLEMYANFMAHPDMFLAITTGTSPEERIVRFVEYYLTAFHEGRKGAVAKKPYNPILGESFRCSWDVPRERVHPLRTMSSVPNTNTKPTSNPAPNPASSSRGSSPNPASSSRGSSPNPASSSRGSSPNPASSSRGSSPNPASSSRGLSPNPASSSRASRRTGTESGGAQAEDCYRVRFVAEQVSHHPPVTGFYCECKERNMCVNTHVWTRSKFMGMSIGVSMVGEGVLRLLEHDEEYVFTLPCAYARSILTVPWVELGGKVTISCAKSGYSATVTFHTKPFYGGKIHRVTAEVKHNPTGTIVCKAQGEWNGTLEFTYSSGETKVINTSKLPVIRKKIRPMDKQGHSESRRLWQHVTSALRSGNIDSATEHKHCLEERQRAEGRQRAASNTPWKPKYFIKEGEGWVYHNPLWKTH